MKKQTFEFYALICNHCGSPIRIDQKEDEKFLLQAIYAFDTKEDALRATLDIYDESGQHPKVEKIDITVFNKH